VDSYTYSARNYYLSLGNSLQGQFQFRQGVERTPELDEKLKAVVTAFGDFWLAMYGGSLSGLGMGAQYTDSTTTSNSETLIDPGA
jgi:hypothetical protein